ncbi:hypothetical protein D3C84_140760 [compost metagenome]
MPKLQTARLELIPAHWLRLALNVSSPSGDQARRKQARKRSVGTYMSIPSLFSTQHDRRAGSLRLEPARTLSIGMHIKRKKL